MRALGKLDRHQGWEGLGTGAGCGLVCWRKERHGRRAGDRAPSRGQEDPQRRDWQPTHSSILAWTIPWTEEPGRLQATGSHRVRHD